MVENRADPPENNQEKDLFHPPVDDRFIIYFGSGIDL